MHLQSPTGGAGKGEGIYPLAPPPPAGLSVDPGHTLTYQLSICSGILFSLPGFQEQQQLRGAIQQLRAPFQ